MEYGGEFLRVRLCVAALAIVVVGVAGCSDPSGGATADTSSASTAPSAPTQTKSVAVTVSISTNECKPPGVPGNCWLPLYPQPALQGTAFNQSATCNNGSRDQSSCWPQPGTKLEVVCTTQGDDGRTWYGVLFHVKHIVATPRPTFPPQGGGSQAIGYAAAMYMVVSGSADALKILPNCLQLT